MTQPSKQKRENSVKETPAAASAAVTASNEEPTLWTLLLTIPGQPRMILEQIPSTCTVSSLYERAQQAVHDTIAAADASVTIGSLKAGFPPRVLSRSDDTTLVEAGLCHQDRIVVELKTAKPKPTTKSAAAKSSKTPQATIGTTSSTTNASTSTQRHSKRAAAAAATASFAETIRAQEEAAAQLASSSSSSRNKRNVSVALRTAAKSTSSSLQKTRFAASATTGRRLNDGAVIPPKVAKTTSRSPRKRRRDDACSAPASADPGVALLNALSSTSKGARLMRQGWRHAVRDAEEQSRSLSRLAAITAGTVQYSNTTTKTTRESDKETENMELNAPLQQLFVTYPKGIQGRGTYTDTVDYLPLDVLQSVIQGIHPVNPEALRPENLALLSPRVLWSLVYHAQHFSNGEGNQKSASVASALQAVAPTLDWSFLRRRREQLSEKALENLRQQQHQQAQAERGGMAVGDDWEAAARAIESVEHAMEELHTYQKSQQQSQLARAALQRMERQQQNQNKKEEDSNTWMIVTPTEFDEDELRDCILAGQSETDNKHRDFCIIGLGSDEAAPVKVPINDVIQWLAHDCEIRNWRELANADLEQMTEDLLQKFSMLAPNQTSNDMKRVLSLVDSWIDFAQTESLGEIMVEICRGNVDAVDLLTRAANSGTPKDLAAWKSIAEILHDVLEEFAAKHNDNDLKVVPSVDEIKSWCDRSQQAMDQFEWLHWFATPIEDAS